MIQGSLLTRLNANVPLEPGIVFVTDPRWPQALAELRTCDHIGFDLETYGDDSPADGLNPWKGEIRLIQVGLPSGLTLIADLGGYYDDRKARAALYVEFLQVLGERLSQVIVCGTELIFDSFYARVKYGWLIPHCRDIKLLSQVLWAGVGTKTNPRLQHSLQAIAARVLNQKIDKTEQRDDWGGKLNNRHFNYAHRDVHIPIACVKILIERLRAEGCLYSAIVECEAIWAFCEFQFNGQPVNKRRLEKAHAAYVRAWNAALAPFTAAFPGVNPASSKQVAEALKERYPDREFKGEGATADNVLAELRDPALDALAEWRSLKTQVDYLGNLLGYFKPIPEWNVVGCGCQGTGDEWGVVRTVYRQIASSANDEDGESGAGMGRSSCGAKGVGPNWQNPGKLQPNWKKMGLPPTRVVVTAPPGYSFLVADLSQCHARIACKVSKDPYLTKAYVEDYDVHSEMASELAKMRGLEGWDSKSIKKWSKDKGHANHSQAKALRDAAKNCYYGSQNLQAWYTLQATCAGATEPVFLTEAECRFLIKLFKDKYAGLVQYQRRTIDHSNTYDYTFSEIGIPGHYGKIVGPTGRRLYLEKLNSKYTGREEVKGTDCVSFVWMGAEADIIKKAASEILRDRDPAWDLRATNMAHDELNFIVRSEFDLAASTLILQTFHRCMSEVLAPDVPPDEKGAEPSGLIVADWSLK